MKMNNKWTEQELKQLAKLTTEGLPRRDIARALGRTPKAIEQAIFRNDVPTAVEIKDPLQKAASAVPKEFGRLPLEVFDGCEWTRLGLVSDTHLCCKEERLDA